MRIWALALLLPALAWGLDDWQIDNQHFPWKQWNNGAAWDGACHGMTWAKVEYHRLGLDKAVPFGQLTDPQNHEPTQGADSKQAFTEEVAVFAQQYVNRGRDPAEYYRLPSNPAAVDKSLKAAKPTPDNPQMLFITNEAAVKKYTTIALMAHSVLVDKREETKNFISYTVEDPNYHDQPQTYVYDKKTGKFLGMGDFDTIRHDTIPLPEQNRQWLDALLRGASQPVKDQYIPIWKGDGDQPKSDTEYKREKDAQTPGKGSLLPPPAPSPELNGGLSATDDGVGGVRLYFDPQVVADPDHGSDRWAMLRDLADQVTAGQSNFLVRKGATQEVMVARLSAIIASPDDNLPFTRLLGCTVDTKSGEVYLLGQKEQDGQPISRDSLVAALHAIWRDGLTPQVSLDPNPDDFYGPQRVRLEGFADGATGEFALAMLEADYAMKKIMLGEEKPLAPDFRSYADLLADNASNAEYVRFWLSPRETAGASAYRTQQGNLTAWYWDSDVRVLTETMKKAQTMLLGTGARNATAEEAAEEFTRCYSQFAAQYPAFARLRGIFDVAKLAAVLRAEGVKSSLLDKAAALPTAPADIPATYAGIGPKLLGTGLGGDLVYIGGGVQARPPMVRDDVATVPGLFDPAAIPDKDSIDVAVPAVLPLDARRARRVDGELETSAALEEFLAGDNAVARARVDVLLKDDPENARGLGLRALCRLGDGDIAGALIDADAGVPAAPALKLIRARIRVYTGDAAGALSDLDDLAKQPDQIDPVVLLFQRAWADLMLQRLPEAADDLDKLATMAPLDDETIGMRKMLRFYRGMDPKDARAFVSAQLALPLTVALRIRNVGELAQQGEMDKAGQLMTEIVGNLPPMPAGGAKLYLEERCWTTLAIILLMSGDTDKAAQGRDYLAKINARHPDWPSPAYLRITLDHELTYPDALALYRKTEKLPPGADPFMLERLVTADQDLHLLAGLQIAMQAGPALEKDPKLPVAGAYQLVDDLTAAIPDGPARHVLKIARAGIRHDELSRAKNPDKKELARIDAEMEQAFFDIPKPAPRAGALDQYALIQTYLPWYAIANAPDQDQEKANRNDDRLFLALAGALDADWNGADTLERAGGLYLKLHADCAKKFTDRLASTPPFAGLEAQVNDGKITLDEATQVVEREGDKLIAGLDNIPPCSADLLRLCLLDGYADILPWADPTELSRLITRRAAALAPNLTEANTLVQQSAAAQWLSLAAPTLAGGDPDTAPAFLTACHKEENGLKRAFTLGLGRE